ncbi:MAG: arylamine N-acetyltransferase [Candidatus Binatia bacterium]
MHPNDAPLEDGLLERVLQRLGLSRRPSLDLAGLREVYGAWSRSVPFDNLRKLLHLADGSPGPLPGDDVLDFLEGWLRWGTGGTCWAGNGALATLLATLGFRAERRLATMLVAPNLPPNHGTVVVTLDGSPWLVDASILFGEPLLLDRDRETSVDHPARGVRCAMREDRWHVRWRALHAPNGLDCRIEERSADAAEFSARHDETRGWSPFNYQVNVRTNRGDRALGIAFGNRVEIDASGAVSLAALDHEARQRVLIQDLGFDPAFVDRVPADMPTPPPPFSRTAAARAEADQPS